MKKMIILRKIHVTMKSFAPRFSCRFITYSIKIGNLDWCKCGHCKNEAREIDCLCCRKVDPMLIASSKISEREENILSSSFYEHLPSVTRVSLIYLVDEIFVLFLV